MRRVRRAHLGRWPGRADEEAVTFRSVLVGAVCALALLALGAAPARAGAAPRNTVAPRVHGHSTVGSTLRAATGTWKGHPTSFAFRWQRCGRSGTHCRAIARATGRRYVVR